VSWHTARVRRTIVAELMQSPAAVFAVVADLSTYPEWMGLVHRVEPAGEDAWLVTLRAKVGPLARSKKLRMRRAVHQLDEVVRFERDELDGREHSAWALDARVEAVGAGSVVTVELSYDGGLWSGPLELVLASQVDDAIPQLRAYLAAITAA
jgi:hypothetical protein